MSNSIKVLSKNENGVIYVENESGVVFGIVDAATITDESGVKFESDTISVIEDNFNCDLEQNWDEGTTKIQTDYLGQIVFSGNDAELVG